MRERHGGAGRPFDDVEERRRVDADDSRIDYRHDIHGLWLTLQDVRLSAEVARAQQADDGLVRLRVGGDRLQQASGHEVQALVAVAAHVQQPATPQVAADGALGKTGAVGLRNGIQDRGLEVHATS